jgi:hypothetical protein
VAPAKLHHTPWTNRGKEKEEEDICVIDNTSLHSSGASEAKSRETSVFNAGIRIKFPTYSLPNAIYSRANPLSHHMVFPEGLNLNNLRVQMNGIFLRYIPYNGAGDKQGLRTVHCLRIKPIKSQ